MENRRILISVIIVLACIPLQGMAYSNNDLGGHPLINKFAIESFEQNIKDPLLKNTSLRGEECWGWAWDETDGLVDVGSRNTIRVFRSKSLQDWIIDGGFSADEPERTMALVHFYDPTKNPNQAYLTDYQSLVKLGTVWYGGNFVNPELSAVDWAFDRDLGSGYFIQDYSWDDGLMYYRDALADTSRTNDKYGQAWRAVGETMHLVSDMTIPAHVRNDGHPTFDQDPYENSVGPYQVRQFRGGEFLNIDYDHGTLRDVMVRIATKVNADFYSADTVPYLKNDRTTGYRYPQPTLEGLKPDAEGYFYYPGSRALVKELYSPILKSSTGIFYLDEEVLNDQRSVLIPTAIRGSAEVLDRFLPRFEARLTVEKLYPRSPDDDQYIVHSTLRQVRTNPDAWSGYDDLIVRNGAYLVVTRDGKKTEQQLSHFSNPILVDATKDQNFNDWVNVYQFKPGTKVQMKYDLGGYVITSNEVTIPELPTTTPTRPTTTPTPYETTDIATNPTTPAGSGPVCGEGGSCQACCYWFMDEDPDVNKAVCTPLWEEDSGVDVGNKYDDGCWMLRAFCSCGTGENLDPSAVDTNIWSSLPDEYKNSEGEGGESTTIREHSGESGTFY